MAKPMLSADTCRRPHFGRLAMVIAQDRHQIHNLLSWPPSSFAAQASLNSHLDRDVAHSAFWFQLNPSKSPTTQHLDIWSQVRQFDKFLRMTGLSREPTLVLEAHDVLNQQVNWQNNLDFDFHQFALPGLRLFKQGPEEVPPLLTFQTDVQLASITGGPVPTYILKPGQFKSSNSPKSGNHCRKASCKPWTVAPGSQK